MDCFLFALELLFPKIILDLEVTDNIMFCYRNPVGQCTTPTYVPPVTGNILIIMIFYYIDNLERFTWCPAELLILWFFEFIGFQWV